MYTFILTYDTTNISSNRKKYSKDKDTQATVFGSHGKSSSMGHCLRETLKSLYLSGKVGHATLFFRDNLNLQIKYVY